MAFSYRNTLDSALSALPQRYSDQILSDLGDKIDSKLKNIQKLFSFRTTPEIQELLANAGIELAPISYQNHSHPACKMIENHILYVSLPNLLQNEYSIGLMSLRSSKAKRFIKMRRFLKNGDFSGVKMFNSIIDSKDMFRYGHDCHIGSFSSRVDKIASEFNEPGFNSRVMMIHDELHYHTPDDIAELFEKVTQLRAVVGTVVCPIEILNGDTVSKNPRIYSFEILDGNLNFFPDGNPSEGYTQPISTSTWYLRTSSVEKGGLRLRVSVIQSIFAHHVVVIDRVGLNDRAFAFYQKPSCLLNSELNIFDRSFCNAQIERGTMSSILTYLACLKTPNAESALAKLRQLEKRALFSDEMYLVSTIAHTFSKIKFNSQELRMSYLDQVRDLICGQIPWLASFFMNEKVWQVQYRNFLKEISCNWFKIALKKIVLKADVCPCSTSFVDYPYSDCPATVSPVERVVVPKGFLARAERAKIAEVDKPSTSGSVLSICGPVSLSTEDHGSRNQSSICRADQSSLQIVHKLSTAPRKNACVFESVAPQIGMSAIVLMEQLCSQDITDDLLKCILNDKPINLSMISEVSNLIGRSVVIDYEGKELIMGMGPAVFIKLANGHCTEMEPYECTLIKPKLPQLGLVNFEAKSDRAKKLAKSFQRGTTGVLLSASDEMKRKIAALEETLSITDSLDVQMSYTWGAPGSGKTRGLINKLKSNDELRAFIVSPRRLLADEWVDALIGANSKVFTHEASLLEDIRTYNVFIFDEITLFPPGFLDLFCYKIVSSRLRSLEIMSKKKKIDSKRVCKIMGEICIHVIGDPMQSRYYSEADEIILPRKHDVDVLVENGACKMLWKTFRMGGWFESLMEIPCLGRDIGSSKLEKFTFFSGLSAVRGKFDVILCASRDDKRNLAGHIPVMTFGESQGLTFNKALIAITDATHKVSDHHLYVGLTRSREQFHFIVTSERSLGENLKVFERKLLGYVLKQEKIKKERLMALFSNSKKVEFVSEELFGSALSEKLVSDPFIMPFADLTEDVGAEEPECTEPVEDRAEMKCHLPLCKVNPLSLEVFDKMSAKENREAYSLFMGATDQFRDVDSGFCNFEMNAAMNFQAIFPKHSSTDSSTFALGVKKRLRFSNTRHEMNEFRERRDIGVKMADFFLKQLPGQFKISRLDIEQGQTEFNQKRASKPTSLFQNHSNRSEIDWPLDWVFIFMKSQLCTKSEKMYVNAKAGQTLACFHHLILFKFGPILRAIELAFGRSVGEKFYIHSRKDFGELDKFAVENGSRFVGMSTESDYEAFDSSQDSTILAFEVALMERLNLPRDFVRDYITLKVTLGSKLGNFAIMRFTGEFCTFLFNTFANMLFTFLKYEVNNNTRMLFAGDDMASIGKLNPRKDGMEKLLDGLRLKAKEDRRQFPMFCGWFLTPDGIYKKPSLLWARLMVMQEKGEIKTCIDNYLLEMAWAYRMGESLYRYLDETEIEAHYKCVRFFIEKSSMCRGEALKVIRTFGSVFGSEGRENKGFDYLSSIVRTMCTRNQVNGPEILTKIGVKRVIQIEPNDPRQQQMFRVMRLTRDREIELIEQQRRLNFKRLREFRVLRAFDQTMKCVENQSKSSEETYHLLSKVSSIFEKGQYLGCQLSKSMTSYFDQKQKNFELMPLIQGRFIKMPTSIQEKFSTALGVLNLMSKCMDPQMKLAYQVSQSLMTMRSVGFRAKLENLTTYTLGLYCSELHRYSQMPTKCLELYQSQIQPCLMRSRDTLPPLKSLSARALHTSQFVLDTAYQFLIHIFRMLSKSLYSFQMLKQYKAESLLGWTLESCTGLRTQLDSFRVGLDQMGGLHRKYKAQKELVINQVCRLTKHTSLNMLMLHASRGTGVFYYLKDYLEAESIRRDWKRKEKVLEAELLKMKNQSWGSLGHPLLDMKEAGLKLLVNMSLQEITRAGTRSRVKRFLWSSFVDPGHDLIAAENLPALPEEPVGVHLEIYDRILNYYMPILFGNMAILGVSGKVIWPSIAIPVPAINFEAGGEQVNWATELILSEVCPALEGWRNTSDFQPLRHGTLRNLAEPFAMEAMKFLKERRQFNVYTNIYIKLPRAFEMAPWVAFDFASGLDLNTLNNDEKTVMERMNTRIFRTEGQKVAFRAQGEANLSLEG